MSLHDIDYAERYRQHMRRALTHPKPPGAWDKRAADMGQRATSGAYGEAFLARVDVSGARSLLDVGCGPGILCLPLAAQLEVVYALDYSPGMLAQLQDNARQRAVDNLKPVLRAWEEDWSDIPRCDILLASRSGLVADLDATLDKIHRHTRLRVYFTQLVGGQFIDPALTRFLGINRPAFPDHIYLLNLLHQRGINPRLDYIETPSRLAGCADFATFAERLAWSLGELNDEQRRRLQDWFEADPHRAQKGGAPMRWAFLAWDVPSS